LWTLLKKDSVDMYKAGHYLLYVDLIVK